jgi:hypothetical protein
MDAQDVRPRFYEGQYLGADDLSTVVAYLRTAQARHALGAHTWGIAIGLQLTEKSAPGGVKRVEVTLQPGFAWDGFARPIANGRPTRLNEDLFAAIPYHPVLDDVAGGGTGRLVEVWIAYDETASGNPPPGFETCATDDQHARIGETFRFEIGQQPLARQRGRVTIGTNAVDAEKALSTFDATAAPLYDTSVPHQRFPFDDKPPRWLVPIGYVRWIARDQALGYFADRNLDATQKAEGRSRAFRRYVGAVAEYIEAAAGAIVLHHRGKSPADPHNFATLLTSTFDPAVLLDDLVWVEGNLRVVGNAKLCGGDLQWRNGYGLDEHTPFYMARRGDNPPVPADGLRELRIVIGPEAQATNRLIIGPEQPPVAPATTPGVAPHLVVVSSGDVGIGRSYPEARLNVVGSRVRLQDTTANPAKRIDLRTDGNGVGVESPTDTLTVRAFGPTAATGQVLINPVATDGRVGIRVQAPQHDVDAKGRSIKLGLEQDGGGQIVLTHTGPDHVLLEARNAAGAASAPELRIVGPAGANLPLVASHADLTFVSNQFSVGVPAPAHDVDIKATRIKLGLETNGGGQLVLNCNPNDNRVYLEGFSTDGTASATEILVTGQWATTLPLFTVRATTSQFTGNVGIGTATPQESLHVAGASLRVDGTANQQAVFGSEGNSAVVVGSRNNAVFYVDMRRLGVAFDTSDANAWLTMYCKSVVEVSDARAKTKIKPIVDALDRVSKLRGVSYVYKGPRDADETAGRLGLIAQEVQKVVPEAVSSGERGSGIAYSTFVPLLVEAVKELKDEVATLRGEVRTLSKLSKRANGSRSRKDKKA